MFPEYWADIAILFALQFFESNATIKEGFFFVSSFGVKTMLIYSLDKNSGSITNLSALSEPIFTGSVSFK